MGGAWDIPEHPDIRSALATGYPAWAGGADGAWDGERRAFAEEEFEEFLDFVLDEDPDILERFTDYFSWRYGAWREGGSKRTGGPF